MEYNSWSNRASDFKSDERVAWGWFEVTSLITPELYDTKSYYQFIVLLRYLLRYPQMEWVGSQRTEITF